MKALRNRGIVVLAMVVGGCAGDPTGSDPSTPLLNADLAAVAADQVAEDIDIMREPVFFPAMPWTVGPALAPAGAPGSGEFSPPAACTYNSSTGRLECPPVERGHVTVTRSYAFWDAGNNSQDHFDPLTTARANIQTEVEGSRDGPAWDATVERSRDMTATGLAGEETQRTWNGTGESHVTRSRHTDNGPDRSYDLECSSTVTDVVVPVPRGDERWPLSGSVTIRCEVTFEGGPRDGETVERTITITFDGTRFASATVGDRTFELDLKDRRRRP